MIWDSTPPDICEGGRDHQFKIDDSTHTRSDPGGAGINRKRGFDNLRQVQHGFCQICGAWRGCLGLEPTPELYIQHMVQIFREVRRVLRSDGTLWLNMGDSYVSQGGDGRAGFNAGVRVDQSSKDKRATTSATGLKTKDLCGIPWMLAFALRADGWYLRSDIIWHKPNPMPESVTDRPTKAHEYLFLLTKSAKYYYDADAIREPHKEPWRSGTKENKLMAKGSNGLSFGGWDYNKREYNPSGRNKRTVWTIPTKPFPEAHFATFPPDLVEPCILAGTSEKGCCVECGSPWERVVEKSGGRDWYNDKMKDKGIPGQILGENGYKRGQSSTPLNDTQKSKTIGWQPTCKCTMDKGARVPCIILDPFLGSGTTFIVSHKHGRKFIGVDLSKPYLDDIAIPRIEKETEQLKLFT